MDDLQGSADVRAIDRAGILALTNYALRDDVPPEVLKSIVSQIRRMAIEMRPYFTADALKSAIDVAQWDALAVVQRAEAESANAVAAANRVKAHSARRRAILDGLAAEASLLSEGALPDSATDDQVEEYIIAALRIGVLAKQVAERPDCEVCNRPMGATDTMGKGAHRECRRRKRTIVLNQLQGAVLNGMMVGQYPISVVAGVAAGKKVCTALALDKAAKIWPGQTHALIVDTSTRYYEQYHPAFEEWLDGWAWSVQTRTWGHQTTGSRIAIRVAHLSSESREPLRRVPLGDIDGFVVVAECQALQAECGDWAPNAIGMLMIGLPSPLCWWVERAEQADGHVIDLFSNQPVNPEFEEALKAAEDELE